MKTASRVLGSALFAEGFEVQDAPRYGAERRGAPVFAYVRADHAPILERGPIAVPDLVLVADDTLVGIPSAGVLAGIGAGCVLLLNSATGPEQWADRLNSSATIMQLPTQDDPAEPLVAARLVGCAARLLGVVTGASLNDAIETELSALGRDVVENNQRAAREAFDAMEERQGLVRQSGVSAVGDRPDWIDVPRELARSAAPVIHAGATSMQVRTGLWRTFRPVIDDSRCKGCWWICSTYCPDGVIAVEEGRPRIDYDHCKGCMICVTQCPSHAIDSVPEVEAARAEPSALPENEDSRA
jgi:pyruvate ferredoxin oxidoreductase gamma subunit